MSEQYFTYPKPGDIADQIDYVDLTLPGLDKVKTISKEQRIIGGYANVAVFDKEGDLFPTTVLRKALVKFLKMGDGRFRNVMVNHESVQIGEVLDSFKEFKTKVDDLGLFVVVKLVSGHVVADKVWELIQTKELNSFSIRGIAKSYHYQKDGTNKKIIDDLELYEVTICQEGMNPYAKFEVLKSVHLSKYSGRFKDLIVIKDCVNLTGSSVKKGEGQDLDVHLKLAEDHPLRRHVEYRIKELFPSDMRAKLHIFGSPEGPHDTYLPLYDLALIRVDPQKRVEMIYDGHASEEGAKRPSELTEENLKEKKNLSENEGLAPPAGEATPKTDLTEGVITTPATGETAPIKPEVASTDAKKDNAPVDPITQLSEKMDSILAAMEKISLAFPPKKPEEDPYDNKKPKAKPADEDEYEKPKVKPEDEEEDKACAKPPKEEDDKDKPKTDTEAPVDVDALKKQIVADIKKDLEKDYPVVKRTKVLNPGGLLGGPADKVKSLLGLSDAELNATDWKEVDRAVEGS